jgi:hypothetical protein
VDDFVQRFGGNSGRVLMIAVLPASIIAAMVVLRTQPAPSVAITLSTTSTPEAEATPIPTILPDTVTPTASPTAADPTATPVPYSIAAVEAQGGLGISNLYIIDAPLQQQAIDPADLHLPALNMYPNTGRFLEIRGTYQLTHLGSDYMDPAEALMSPPHEGAMLAALVHLKRSTYTAIAVDMSGDVQIYLIMLNSDDGAKQYLFCFAHLSDGSNTAALDQARASGGYVTTMGSVSTVSSSDGSLSDVHVAVIDVDVLYQYADTRDLTGALHVLFSGTLPRIGQQYTYLFVKPEDVYPALADNLKKYRPEDVDE